MRKEDKKRLENEKLAQKNRDLANDFYGMYSLSGYDPAAGLFDNSRKRR